MLTFFRLTKAICSLAPRCKGANGNCFFFILVFHVGGKEEDTIKRHNMIITILSAVGKKKGILKLVDLTLLQFGSQVLRFLAILN